jgi:nicotinamidase/pyrazinamidase
VQGTRGAELHAELERDEIDEIVQKGVDPATDGYSGFAGTDLAERLRSRGVKRVVVAGLATDYCVRATTLEAMQNGFEAALIADAVRAVELKPGDGRSALEEMEAAGATITTSEQLNS